MGLVLCFLSTPRDQALASLVVVTVLVYGVMYGRRRSGMRAFWRELFTRSRRCDHVFGIGAIRCRGMFYRNTWRTYGVMQADSEHLTIRVPGPVAVGSYCIDRDAIDNLTVVGRAWGHEYQFQRDGVVVSGVSFVRTWEDAEAIQQLDGLGWLRQGT